MRSAVRFSGRLLLLLLAGGLLLALAGAHAKKDRSPDGGVQGEGEVPDPLGEADTMPEAAPAPITCDEWKAKEDAPEKSDVWQLCHEGNVEALRKWVEADPCLAESRAADGRGPLFWAYEFENADLVELFLASGADAAATDKDGAEPAAMTSTPRADWGKKKDVKEEEAPAGGEPATTQPTASASSVLDTEYEDSEDDEF